MIEAEDRERRAKKLRQIKVLLDKADATGFTEEADALRQKADDLMLAYAISEAELDATRRPEQRTKPERRRIVVCGVNNDLHREFGDLISIVAAHARCRIVYHGLDHNSIMPLEVTVFGFPADLDYVDMLFTSLRLQMATELEPKPDPNKSFEENVAILKESGLKWQRVYELLYPEDYAREPVVPKSVGVRFTKTYTDYCERTGRPRMRTSPKTYVRNFALGYVSRVADRLRQIRHHQQETHVGGTGTDLMLRDRAQEVADLMHETFPELSSAKRRKLGKLDHGAIEMGRAAGARADLGQTRVGGGRKGLNA